MALILSSIFNPTPNPNPQALPPCTECGFEDVTVWATPPELCPELASRGPARMLTDPSRSKRVFFEFTATYKDK